MISLVNGMIQRVGGDIQARVINKSEVRATEPNFTDKRRIVTPRTKNAYPVNNQFEIAMKSHFILGKSY